MSIISVALATAVAVVVAPTNIHLSLSVFEQSQAGLPAHVYIIAQKYGGDDPHGDDPHGSDPHDEVHDDDLPANADQKENKAPKDVYGDKYQNTKAPY